MSKIIDIKGREILDSRGYPTVEVDVILENGIIGRASVPSGASTGKREAIEVRDGGKRYMGKGVTRVVKNINGPLKKLIVGYDAYDQMGIDNLLYKENAEAKKPYGSNATLAISLAILKASAQTARRTIYDYVGNGRKIPVPMMNILNGGKHADNNLDIQEFMIIPEAKKIKDRIRMGAEIFHNLKKILKEKGLNTNVGDEGGFAPELKNNEEAIKLIIKAIKKAGYKPGEEVNIALDVAASELYEDGKYHLNNKTYTIDKLIEYYSKLIEKYPIVSIEDPVDQDDWKGFKKITEVLGDKIQIVGDDMFTTNSIYLDIGIKAKAGNAIIIKPNQIGTITQMVETINLAKANNYKTIMSHRSGETEDTTIVDLAVGLGVDEIKVGSLSRTDRVAKYNQLMRIGEEVKK